jgi:hypothetical protein
LGAELTAGLDSAGRARELGGTERERKAGDSKQRCARKDSTADDGHERSAARTGEQQAEIGSRVQQRSSIQWP